MLPHNINQVILPFSQSYVKQKNCHFQEKKYILPSCAKRVQGCIMLLLILTAEDKHHV